MPIEINELHIKINVEDSKKEPSAGKMKPQKEGNQDDMISECVEEVMRLIKK